jgi:hypothetical protein
MISARPILVISIDDSFQYAIDIASILQRNDLKGSFFFDAGRIGRAMDRATLRRVAEHHEVGSHSVTHRYMTRMSLGDCLREMRESKIELEEITGRSVLSFAFPYGDYNARLGSLALAAGYLCTRGAAQGHFTLPTAVNDINVSLELTPKRLRLLYYSTRFVSIYGKSALRCVLVLLIANILSAFVSLPHLTNPRSQQMSVLHLLLHPYYFRQTSELRLLDKFLRLLIDSIHPTNLTVCELAALVKARFAPGDHLVAKR